MKRYFCVSFVLARFLERVYMCNYCQPSYILSGFQKCVVSFFLSTVPTSDFLWYCYDYHFCVISFGWLVHLLPDERHRHLILMHFDKLWCFCVIVVLMNMLTQFNHVENGFTKYTRRNYNDESMAKTIFYNFLLDILYASLVLFFFFYIFTNIHYFSTTKTELQFSTTSQSVIRLLCFTDHFVCLPVKKSSLITTARSVCVWNCTTTGLTEAVLYVL